MVTLLRGTSPEPGPVKLIPHFLLQLHDIFIRLDRRHDLVGCGDRVDMHLCVVVTALAMSVVVAQRQQPLLHQPVAALLLQRLPAQPGWKLVHGQHQEVHEGAGAAAAYHRALRRCPARHLPKPHSAAPISGG